MGTKSRWIKSIEDILQLEDDLLGKLPSIFITFYPAIAEPESIKLWDIELIEVDECCHTLMSFVVMYFGKDSVTKDEINAQLRNIINIIKDYMRADIEGGFYLELETNLLEYKRHKAN